MLQCVDDLATPDPDPECPAVLVLDPLDPADPPPNEQTQKKLVGDCLVGINCNSIWGLKTDDPATAGVNEATRIAAVSGTSVPELCQAFNSIYDIGDRVVVIVYNDVLYNPDHGSYWENVDVLFYAIYEVTDLKPTEAHCNNVEARLIDATPYSSLQGIDGLHSREISWDYYGVIPGFEG
jgi:hypothetical protein